MPAIRTPSIVQQRIILVAFFLVIGVVAWWRNAVGNFNYSAQKFSKTPVPAVVDELDFAIAEAAWSGLTIDPRGNLQIDALTETALSDGIALVQGPSSEMAMARMALLLEKQFGSTASRQIMELVPILGSYKAAEQRWLEENLGKTPPRYAELFELQDQLLGATLAEKLFSRQRRLAAVMLATRQIQNDTGLTQAEKDRVLMELQRTLQKEGASSEKSQVE